jgi:rhamnogalacturonyl hydrolase YesR
MKDKILSRLYLLLKNILGRGDEIEKHLYFYDVQSDNRSKIDNGDLVQKQNCFPVENVCINSTNCLSLKKSFSSKKGHLYKGLSLDQAAKKWQQFIESSKIPEGYKYAGLSYGGYIAEYKSWCLPSWIWTNAAIVRYYVSSNQLSKAKDLGSILLQQQFENGSWLVRYDYSKKGTLRIVAPNDAAYIANNAMLELYLATNEKGYLDSAEWCADWIMCTAKKDGLVWFGMESDSGKWINDRNIVDIGFTAGLFARLYEITGGKKYYQFLERFINKYIEVFYDAKKNMFCTTIDKDGNQLGGYFARGQAWALEGLIPAYRVLKSDGLLRIVNQTVDSLLANQDKSGAWPYNLSRKWMGLDCKGTPVIAYDLSIWDKYTDKGRIQESISKALNWCAANTSKTRGSEGGIFSFSYEGAVVHHLNTETAFVYGASHALEALHKLEGTI